jgi:hypothetical protein
MKKSQKTEFSKLFRFKNLFIPVEKAKSRTSSELFYDTTENTAIQNYVPEDNQKNDACEYGAKVIEYKENDYSLLEIRNKLSIGDNLEVIVPNKLEPVKFVIDSLRDVETGEEIPTINPGKEGQKVLMKLPCFAEEDYVIRRICK